MISWAQTKDIYKNDICLSTWSLHLLFALNFIVDFCEGKVGLKVRISWFSHFSWRTELKILEALGLARESWARGHSEGC